MLAGVAYRPELAAWLDARPAEVFCVEISVEQFVGPATGRLRPLREAHRLILHGAQLSLGTPFPLKESALEAFAGAADAADPLWTCEYLGFRHTPELLLPHPVPFRFDPESLALLTYHCLRVTQRTGRRLLLENVFTRLRVPGTISEPGFLNRLCEATGCGVLLDITTLFCNALNLGFDARDWLEELDPAHVVELHVGGCVHGPGGWLDLHEAPVREEVWELAAGVVARAPVQAVVLERDGNFPPLPALADEVRRIASLALPAPERSAP